MKVARLTLFALALFAAGSAVADKPTYAKARKAEVPGIGWADHTYACYKSSKEYCYANKGGNTGGSELSGTRGSSDTDHVKCVNEEGKKPSQVCHLYYGTEGVCHQETNLGLALTGNTVSRANGWSKSKVLFGTYGNGGSAECIETCSKR